MQSNHLARVVILGTGGTIAGTAAAPGDHVDYQAAQLGVADLMAAIPSLSGFSLEAEQVAQIDSKDMDAATWHLLAQRAAFHLARPDVAGLVITHGTDTLEETAYFLHRVLAPAKPVVLTAAMRPATALGADGPQNMVDAVELALTPEASGVLVVLAGAVHSPLDVRKAHTYRVDAFSSGDAGELAQIEMGRLRKHRDWPTGEAFGIDHLPADAAQWPRVEIITSHAGARGELVDALVAGGVDGIVIAGTGNGTLHDALSAALQRAEARGVRVLRSSRCLEGAVLEGSAQRFASAGALTPVKARISLMLDLMPADTSAAPR